MIDDEKILLSVPHLGEYEKIYVQEAFETNWIAPVGPHIDAFENEIATYLNCRGAAALSSGTAAIHLALILLEINQGDSVICSDLTFVASANPILYQFAEPIFVDSEIKSWNMCPESLHLAIEKSRKIGKMPKAIITVNLYGQSANYKMIRELANHYGIPIIEDAAESLGAKFGDLYSGTLGDLGIFSFNGNKIITASGGGMLVSNNVEYIEKAKFLSTQAKDLSDFYQHSMIGYNYRMSNVVAAIGRGQLQYLEERISSRKQVFDRYLRAFSDISCISWMPDPGYGKSTRWLSVMYLDESKTDVSAEHVVQECKKSNIEARRVWKPMHLQPLFQKNQFYSVSNENPISTRLFNNGVCLPSSSSLSIKQQDRVINVIRACL